MKRIIFGAVTLVAALLVCGAISLAPAYNNASLDLYVDCVNGQDSSPIFGGACTSPTSPCRDPQYAINQLNKNVSAQIAVHILGPTDGGTPYTCYADDAADAGAPATLEVDAFNVNLGINPQASLTIDCAVSETLAPVTATGFTAGTATSPPLLTVSTASWTPSAFKGQFVRVLSGTGAGNTYVIVDNDTTNLTVLTNNAALDNTTNFDIIKPAASISDALASSPSTGVSAEAVRVLNCSGAAGSGATPFGASTSPKIAIAHCDAAIHSSKIGFLVSGSRGVSIAYDTMTSSSSLRGVQVIGATDVSVFSSYFTGASSALGVFPLNSNGYAPASAVFQASYASKGIAAVNGNGAQIGAAFSYATGTGSSVLTTFYGGQVEINGGWFNQTGGTALTMSPFSQAVIFGLSQYGTPASLAVLSSGSQLQFDSPTVTTATNFVSLDNGSTYVSKATIEAATNKTICTIGTTGTPLGCAKEQ